MNIHYTDQRHTYKNHVSQSRHAYLPERWIRLMCIYQIVIYPLFLSIPVRIYEYQLVQTFHNFNKLADRHNTLGNVWGPSANETRRKMFCTLFGSTPWVHDALPYASHAHSTSERMCNLWSCSAPSGLMNWRTCYSVGTSFEAWCSMASICPFKRIFFRFVKGHSKKCLCFDYFYHIILIWWVIHSS